MKVHRFLSIVIAVLSTASLLHAELTEEQAKKLFNAEASLEDFNKAVAEAAKLGVPAQTLAEAKLVRGLQNQDTAYLSSVLPELEAAAKNFKKEDSAGLGSAEDFNGLICYIKAMDAAAKGDEAGLKKHITEAFWLSPEQSGLFAEAVKKFRTEAKMAGIRVDMTKPITNSAAEATTLGDVLGKNKAVLLDFWASWCGPCMELMPELRKKAGHLAKHAIAVAGMNTEGDAAIAGKVRNEKGMKEVTWLVEPKDKPFSDLLEIDSIPRMVLLSPEGKILFNGHPEDPGLWAALKKVDAAIEPLKAAE
jgi:thiol-disulfide isomerase/thioredoxin